MTNERVKTLPAKKLDHFLSIEILYQNKRAGNTDKSTSQQQFPIFSPELSKMKRSVELRHRSSSIFCDAQVKIFHARSTETIFRILTSYSCWDLWEIPLQIVLEALFIYSTSFTFIEFVFKLVVACSFWVARVIKNTLRNLEALWSDRKWPEVRFNRKQTSMDDPSAI